MLILGRRVVIATQLMNVFRFTHGYAICRRRLRIRSQKLVNIWERISDPRNSSRFVVPLLSCVWVEDELDVF